MGIHINERHAGMIQNTDGTVTNVYTNDQTGNFRIETTGRPYTTYDLTDFHPSLVPLHVKERSDKEVFHDLFTSVGTGIGIIGSISILITIINMLLGR